MTGHGAHSHRENGGNLPGGSAPGCQNVFCFLLSKQRGLSATYPAPISAIFETADVNCFPHAYAGENFSNLFLRRGFFRSQNSPKYDNLGCGPCDRAAAQTAQLWAVGMISGASRHPKDVPFVREFWWGTYGLGVIRLRKSPNSGDFIT